MLNIKKKDSSVFSLLKVSCEMFGGFEKRQRQPGQTSSSCRPHTSAVLDTHVLRGIYDTGVVAKLKGANDSCPRSHQQVGRHLLP